MSQALITPSTPGVIASKVISWDPSPESEIPLGNLLSRWCDTQIEPQEESQLRQQVLFKLKEIINWWVPHVLRTKQGLSAVDAAQYEGRMFTTGSYRYNVHTTGSDIDAVLIAPVGITRQDFFTSFLERLYQEPWVTDIVPVSNAKVPIIAMKCHGVDMDLSFGNIQRTKVPATITDDLLKGLDERSMMSANAVRVASALIDFAPNKNTFRSALRFVKAWAKRRGIHGSQFGFPTGIGWAILVCYVCQLYPNQTAASVLRKFFYFYTTWFRPNPYERQRMNPCVHLTEKRITSNELGRSWDPQENKMHARALFPVLTPVAPSTDSCDMVGEQTLKILCSEFARGNDLFQNCKYGTSTVPPGSCTKDGTEVPFGIWSEVLEPYPFFENHKTFLHVRVSCHSSAPEKYRPFVDSVATKIKEIYSYGKGLDRYPGVAVRPCAKGFEADEEVKYRDECMNVLLSSGTFAPGGMTDGGDVIAGPSAATTKGTLPPAPCQWLTSHFFIAMDIVTPPATATTATAGGTAAKQQQKIDLTEIRESFINSVVNKGGRYEEGITRKPEFSVVKQSDIPTWIFDPSKSKVLAARAARDEEERLAAAAASAAAAAAATEAMANPLGEGGLPNGIGTKRQREEDDMGVDLVSDVGVTLCADGELTNATTKAATTSEVAEENADGTTNLPTKTGGSVVRSILARGRLLKAASASAGKKPSMVVDDIGMDF